MSKSAGQSFLEPEAIQAMDAALAHLDEAGTINYRSFDANTIHAMYEETGFVEQLVPEKSGIDQLPDIVVEGEVVLTSARRFVNESNNFGLYFYDGWVSDSYRNNGLYRRFQILFPDLECAARVAILGYHRRRQAEVQRDSFYHEEDTAVFMRSVFRFMQQLIDANDPEVLRHPGMAGYWLTA